MKRIFSILFALVLAVSLVLVPAASVGASPGPGIVELWHLDEGSGTIAYDSSGTTPPNDGTIYGATYVDGRFGKALSFDGMDDYVDATLLNISSGATVTLSFWGKPEAIAGQGVGIMIGSAYGFGWDSPGNRWWVLRSGVANYYGTPNKVPADSWAHFVAVVTSSNTNVYINGSLDGSAAVGHAGGTVLIGKRNNNIQYFKGLIDEVCIWDEARTADQIYQSYAALHVDDDGAEWPGAYPTITQALAVANPGDTIIVHIGNYDESVSITTNNLTLEADGAVIVDPPGSGSAITVTADGVVIDGFEITGVTGGEGISFSGSHNTFSNNEIHGIDTGDTGGGISCWDLDGGSDYNTISNNTIYDVSANGILFGACSPSAVNTGNVIRNNTIHSCGTWNPGIEVVNGDQFAILGNHVSGYTGWPQYYGISVDAWNGIPQGGHNISRNEVEGYYYGILLMVDTGEGGYGGVIHGYSVPSSVALDDNLISKNDVHDNLYHGIVLRVVAVSVPATVSGNNISRNNAHDNTTYHGIYVMAGANSNEVHHNTANNNGGDGIKVAGDNNKIHHNTATGNGNLDYEDVGTGNRSFKNK